MNKIDYNYYFNKVFGCYIGKCAGGNFGAKYEGMKQVLNVRATENIFSDKLPNDDLDLQVLWLEKLKEKGEFITRYDFAEAFRNDCPYSPGEYAVFKRNYDRGVLPPQSGTFNNDYYHQGMGCPIRAEIWGCVFPLNPEMARKYSILDGCQDHSNESIYAEIIISSIISMSFAETDLYNLIHNSLEYIPEDSKVYRLVTDVIEFCKKSNDILVVRENILQNYGHPDCTNLFQNIGIIFASLILGDKNFLKTLEYANNCGYDTDCTASTVGAILGAILGGDKLCEMFKITDVPFTLGVNCYDYAGSIRELSKQICEVGLHFSGNINKMFQCEKISNLNIKNPQILFDINEYNFLISEGDVRIVKIFIKNLCNSSTEIELDLKIPDGFIGNVLNSTDTIEGNGIKEILIEVEMLKSNILCGQNLIELNAYAFDKKFSITFGFVVPTIYYCSKAFFENNFNIDENKHESYYEFFNDFEESVRSDKIRNYHINSYVNRNIDYLPMNTLSQGDIANLNVKSTYREKIDISEFTSVAGPCTLYIVREFISENDMLINLNIGCTDYIEIYLNGYFLGRNEENCWWTAENLHFENVKIRKGANFIAFKAARSGETAYFSCAFLNSGKTMDFPSHITNMKQNNAN